MNKVELRTVFAWVVPIDARDFKPRQQTVPQSYFDEAQKRGSMLCEMFNVIVCKDEITALRRANDLAGAKLVSLHEELKSVKETLRWSFESSL
ncbi:hypothetical protein [Planctopirus hydrillae]|uniref:Uncharacterized protein n=1 Tax=Planctopirus hydrillae TaxID=1841610 RepID=A0A1C3E480_9PLAN|nr:hypothetical protein [Planctopirus hydrillae]ODA28051.1 hypothetical protein A6X21_14415 [Planctopirus hydrillae]